MHDSVAVCLRGLLRSCLHFRLEADFTVTGVWLKFIKFTVPPGKPLEPRLSDAFGA